MATHSEHAVHLDVDIKTVGRLLVKFKLPKKGCGLDELRLAYLDHIREIAAGRRGDNDTYDLVEERGRLAHFQANAQDLKNQVTERSMAPVVLVELAMERLGTEIKSILQAIPLKLKKRVPHLKASEIEIVKREIVKVQNAASKIKINWDDAEG